MLNSRETALVIVDVQEAFRSVVSDFPQVAARCSLAVRGFQILDLPIFITEQYPKGLGRTAEEILFTVPPEFEFDEKSAFSSCGSLAFLEKLKNVGAKQILIGGLETHICVNQTVNDLLDKGFEVHLLTDCVASRFAADKETALSKMQSSGAIFSCVEMALFELLRDSKHEKFKEIQNLIK